MVSYWLDVVTKSEEAARLERIIGALCFDTMWEVYGFDTMKKNHKNTHTHMVSCWLDVVTKSEETARLEQIIGALWL